MAMIPPIKKPQHQPLIDPTPLPTSKLTIPLDGSNLVSSNTWNPLNIKDHMIQGECLYVEHRVNMLEAQRIGLDIMPDVFEEEIKKGLTLQIAEELRKSKKIEFTRTLLPDTHEYIFRARVFVVPDTNVRILREAKIVK